MSEDIRDFPYTLQVNAYPDRDSKRTPLEDNVKCVAAPATLSVLTP
jgi:hypothetical protein